MKSTAAKCHLIMSTNESLGFHLGSLLTERSECEKMLGVKIDYKLNFEELFNKLINNKLIAFARATPNMSVEKKKVLINSWMLHSRRNHYIIRNLHE